MLFCIFFSFCVGISYINNKPFSHSLFPFFVTGPILFPVICLESWMYNCNIVCTRSNFKFEMVRIPRCVWIFMNHRLVHTNILPVICFVLINVVHLFLNIFVSFIQSWVGIRQTGPYL